MHISCPLAMERTLKSLAYALSCHIHQISLFEYVCNVEGLPQLHIGRDLLDLSSRADMCSFGAPHGTRFALRTTLNQAAWHLPSSHHPPETLVGTSWVALQPLPSDFFLVLLSCGLARHDNPLARHCILPRSPCGSESLCCLPPRPPLSQTPSSHSCKWTSSQPLFRIYRHLQRRATRH